MLTGHVGEVAVGEPTHTGNSVTEAGCHSSSSPALKRARHPFSGGWTVTENSLPPLYWTLFYTKCTFTLGFISLWSFMCLSTLCLLWLDELSSCFRGRSHWVGTEKRTDSRSDRGFTFVPYDSGSWLYLSYRWSHTYCKEWWDILSLPNEVFLAKSLPWTR